MLKHTNRNIPQTGYDQPPSGGCVLKREIEVKRAEQKKPAAFGRLCVETRGRLYVKLHKGPAAFGRLCVETANRRELAAFWSQPPSGGCVLKLTPAARIVQRLPSRLRAAVC